MQVFHLTSGGISWEIGIKCFHQEGSLFYKMLIGTMEERTSARPRMDSDFPTPLMLL